MKKLTLDLDSLDVASFELPLPEADARGTVEAHSLTTAEKLRDYAVSWLLACAN